MTVPAWRAWWCRLLDGAHVWGTFDAMVGRYGLRRYRLVVYPPGIASADRRLLRLYRGWPVAGGIFFMLAAMLLGDTVWSPWTTFLVAAAGGTINPAHHEALWWQAYDHLEVPAHV